MKRNYGRGRKEPLSRVPQKQTESGVRAALTIPELEQSKPAVLNTLASVHSRRCYAFAIDRFIVPGGIAGEEENHAGGIVRLIEFCHSGRHASFAPHPLGHPTGIGCARIKLLRTGIRATRNTIEVELFMWRLCSLFLFVAALFGQTVLPAFDVADIKINNSGADGSNCDFQNGRLACTNLQLRILIARVWTMTPDDVVGPSWLDDVRVDIIAKAADPKTPDGELRVMAQRLLKERMALVMHIEQREKSVWALSVSKGEPKLTQSTMPEKREDSDCSFVSGGPGSHLVCKHMTMAMFAHEISNNARDYADKRVLDKTGLDGAWDFRLDWTPLVQLENNGGLTLFAALQSQLGLQMENKKLPVAVVVVDNMSRTPTEN